MRIISGKYKGRRLHIPANYKARPTTDFAKENLFNILNNRIDWEGLSALDLFGGTGSISFELISRGCNPVVCIEKSAPNHAFINKMKDVLKAEELNVLKADVFKYLERCNNKFDFIFADPPYDLPNLEAIPIRVLEKEMLNIGGVFVMEHSKQNDFSSLPLFVEKRVYGSVNFSIFINEETE